MVFGLGEFGVRVYKVNDKLVSFELIKIGEYFRFGGLFFLNEFLLVNLVMIMLVEEFVWLWWCDLEIVLVCFFEVLWWCVWGNFECFGF